MNIIQAKMLAMGLELEIKTMKEGRKMQLTREASMHALGRLCDFDAYGTFGKGVKGRQKALEWLIEVLEDNGYKYESMYKN